MKQAHKISVIVCSSGQGPELDRCLCSLCCQDYFPYEIIVVDTTPQQGQARQIVACFEGITYVPVYRKGIRLAHSRAASVASGDILACIDDGCIAGPQWLSGIAGGFRDPQTACCTGPVLTMDTQHPAKQHNASTGQLQKQFDNLTIGTITELLAFQPWIFAPGTNIAFSRPAVEQVCPSCAILPNAENPAIIFAMISRGFHLVYEPAAQIRRLHRLQSRGLHRRVCQWGYGGVTCLCHAVATDRTHRTRALRDLSSWFFCRLKAVLRHRRYPLDLGLLELAGGLTALPVYWINRLLAHCWQTANPEPPVPMVPTACPPLQPKP